MKKTFIYGLKCPITEQIRYIGKSDKPKERYHNHMCDKNDYHRNRWIKSLKLKGLKPELVIIDEVDNILWEEYEIKYIKLFKSFGADLTNRTNGGDVYPDTRGSKNALFGKIGYLNHRSKAILIFDSKGNYIEEIGSMRQCEKKYNIDFSSIVRCCKGTLYTSGGYTFRYKSDFIEVPNKIEIKVKEYRKGANSPVSIPISQYDLKGNFIKSFDSISHAVKETGLNISSIRKNLAKKVNPRKYEFRYN